jgi:hypothetical protein
MNNECTARNAWKWKIDENKAVLDLPKRCQRCAAEKFQNCVQEGWEKETGNPEINVTLFVGGHGKVEMQPKIEHLDENPVEVTED